MEEDYYQTLGVDRNASAQDVKRAYRRLAQKYHPDREGGDEETFKRVNAAYRVLSDDEKRARYDRFGHSFEQAGGFGGGGPDININFDDFGHIGSIFEQFFGGGAGPAAARREGVRRGDDIAVDATVSFAESARGAKKTLQHRVYQKCPRCRGNRAEPGTPLRSCPDCAGTGTTSSARRTMLGTFMQRVVCETCRGEGKRAETPCSQCRGEGRVMEDRVLEMNIPAGIADGQTVRVSGQGAAGPGGAPPGDLYVTVHVTPHRVLKRDGFNVRSGVEIPFTDAALGASLKVETLDGEKELKIPAGTQPGTEFTLPGLGFSRLDGSGPGDHVITVKVVIPKRLSRQQRKLLAQLRNAKERKFF